MNYNAFEFAATNYYDTVVSRIWDWENINKINNKLSAPQKTLLRKHL